MVIKEAHRAGLTIPQALALLQKETGIPQRNVFGCDWGPQGGQPPYCGDVVTRERVRALLRSGKSNGVGWTQLTYRAFVIRAEKLGGAHKPRYQMRVAFDVLSDLISAYGQYGGYRRYNGSGPEAERYAREALVLVAWWQKHL
jgi:hypothetical protein